MQRESTNGYYGRLQLFYKHEFLLRVRKWIVRKLLRRNQFLCQENCFDPVHWQWIWICTLPFPMTKYMLDLVNTCCCGTIHFLYINHIICKFSWGTGHVCLAFLSDLKSLSVDRHHLRNHQLQSGKCQKPAISFWLSFFSSNDHTRHCTYNQSWQKEIKWGERLFLRF